MFANQLVSEEETPILGINPLTLAIALVVITILIAAGLSFWASGVGVKNPEKETDCSFANFKLYSGTYDFSKGSMFFILENLQPTDLKSMTLFVFYPDRTIIEKPMEGKLEASKIKSYEFAEIPNNFEKCLIKTNCPSVNIEFISQNGVLKKI